MLMFLVLVLVTFGVCTINLSSLNLTEALDFDFEKDAESMTNAESTAEKDAWDKFSKDLEKDGIDFNNFDSEEEALNLAKKIYEKRWFR